MRVGVKLPVEGTVFDWDIAEIMERESIDVDDYIRGDTLSEKWEILLKQKRRDRHYEDVKTSIERWGFVRPLTAYTSTGQLQFGDGHHRLAAAIELGMTTVPVEVFKWDHVAIDSGDWDLTIGIDSARAVEYL